MLFPFHPSELNPSNSSVKGEVIPLVPQNLCNFEVKLVSFSIRLKFKGSPIQIPVVLIPFLFRFRFEVWLKGKTASCVDNQTWTSDDISPFWKVALAPCKSVIIMRVWISQTNEGNICSLFWNLLLCSLLACMDNGRHLWRQFTFSSPTQRGLLIYYYS